MDVSNDDFRNEISISLEQARMLSSIIVGKECTHFSRGYGGVYTLHFGELRLVGPSGRKNYLGDWWISTEGTDFELRDDNSIILDTSQFDINDEEPIQAIQLGLQRLLNARLIRCEISEAASLLLYFDNNLALYVKPDPSDDIYDLPYWTILFPTEVGIDAGKNREFHFFAD